MWKKHNNAPKFLSGGKLVLELSHFHCFSLCGSIYRSLMRNTNDIEIPRGSENVKALGQRSCHVRDFTMNKT